MNKLFVSGFPLEISVMELARLTAPHGNISTIKIVRDRKTRICKGYAFVEMVTEEDAMQAADALNGLVMGERELTVKLSEEKPVVKQKPAFTKSNPGFAYSQSSAGLKSERPKRPRRPVA